MSAFFAKIPMVLFAAAFLSTVPFAQADEPPVVRSVQSGAWSSPQTWDAGRVPKTGDRVLIRPGHFVGYDVESAEVIRMVQIAGTLEFARDRNTRLEVGLVKIAHDEDLSEDGFDCRMAPEPMAPGMPRPSLIVGTMESPIPSGHTALIRLHFLPDMNPETCPAIVCCGGRMDLHGAPLAHSWVKLDRTALANASNISVAEAVDDWKEGDLVMVVATNFPRVGIGNRAGGVAEQSQTELRHLTALHRGRPPQSTAFTTTANEKSAAEMRGELAAKKSDAEYSKQESKSAGDSESAKEAPKASAAAVAAPADFFGQRGRRLQLDEPLKFEHYAEGGYCGEVANLSRNVIVESADPDGVRGHTMYHANSAGSISYAEFRHLGKRDVLGKYAIHFHQVGDTMRGSSVVGASIWDSQNRWITIHGTNYLIVRDCVGFKSVGHGFFLEDGTETLNVLDHNLAVQALKGKALPKQFLPFDENRGAGFWWVNCQNSFTNNVAAECDEYGYRFECKQTDDYDPMQTVLLPDGTKQPQDIRLLPFVKFENNEAHSQPFFGLNLRGIVRPAKELDFYALNETLTKEANEAHPDPRHPFWIHNYKAWNTNWAFHGGTSGVFLDGFDAFRCEYGIWRSVIDRHTWLHMSFKEIYNKDLHMPFSVGVPETDKAREMKYFQGIPRFQNDAPPTTVITEATRQGDEIVVRGTTSDSSAIKRVTVNGRKAHSIGDNFGQWEVSFAVAEGKPFTISASAEDELGHLEPRPHVVELNGQEVCTKTAAR